MTTEKTYCKFIAECKSCKDYVAYLLHSNPSLRDNDGQLMYQTWALMNLSNFQRIHMEASTNTIYIADFARSIMDGKFNPETVRRVRQKLQEANPELRGKLYYERHVEGDLVTEQIHDI